MYPVWITIEEWDNDQKICDTDSCKLGESESRDEAMILFDAAQDVSIAIKPHLSVKFEDEV
ncbi:MAG: hypothetical protein PHF37_00435 [Phycisphaerae bacterium]|nr:hypothetical protein [Phycisphaerae bacterium]